MKDTLVKVWTGGTLVIACAFIAACADKNSDASRPSSSGHKGLQERLSDAGGYKQDEGGQWVPRSDKRSSYDSQRESAYFKGKMDKKEYRTGDYEGKKSWWGSKEYGTSEFAGEKGQSRFQGTQARQDGITARDDGKGARESGTYETSANRLDGKTARESGSSEIERPIDAGIQARRDVYKAPSVIDWREQRSMSVERSKGILGR